jgi:hypothetical protein
MEEIDREDASPVRLQDLAPRHPNYIATSCRLASRADSTRRTHEVPQFAEHALAGQERAVQRGTPRLSPRSEKCLLAGGGGPRIRYVGHAQGRSRHRWEGHG